MKRFEILKGITEGTIFPGTTFKSKQHTEKLEVRDFHIHDVPAIGLFFTGTSQQVAIAYVEGEEWEEDTEARVLGQVKYAADKLSILAGQVANKDIEADAVYMELMGAINFLEGLARSNEQG
jgi:hypothetical protein